MSHGPKYVSSRIGKKTCVCGRERGLGRNGFWGRLGREDKEREKKEAMGKFIFVDGIKGVKCGSVLESGWNDIYATSNSRVW